MEDQDIHHIIQMALDDGPVLATGLVGSLNAAPAPICPIDVILVLSQAKRVRQVIGYNFTVKACFQKRERGKQEELLGTYWVFLTMC